MTHCKNCNSEVADKYCPSCGQAAKLKRINGHYIVHEIEHILHFERGILYPIKELLIRPSEIVRTFMTENRSRLVKPVIFIIVTSLIYSLISSLFQVEDDYVNFQEEEMSTTGLIFQWVLLWISLSNN